MTMNWRKKICGERNKGGRREGDKNRKGITGRKKEMVFSVVFLGLCAICNDVNGRFQSAHREENNVCCLRLRVS